jgi:hypothetical protein
VDSVLKEIILSRLHAIKDIFQVAFRLGRPQSSQHSTKSLADKLKPATSLYGVRAERTQTNFSHTDTEKAKPHTLALLVPTRTLGRFGGDQCSLLITIPRSPKALHCAPRHPSLPRTSYNGRRQEVSDRNLCVKKPRHFRLIDS